MVISNVEKLCACVLLLCAAQGAAAARPSVPADTARASTARAIILDAQGVDGGLESNDITLRKVHISQGTLSISADQGQGVNQTKRFDFENSVWTFRGNVKVTTQQGQISSDDAEINFVKQTLSKAVFRGKPATLEQHVVKTGKLAEGHADSIDYDAGKGIVTLSKNAWLSNGDSEIRGESLKYNMVAQSIVADAADQGSQRVHIVIPPPPSSPPPAATP